MKNQVVGRRLFLSVNLRDVTWNRHNRINYHLLNCWNIKSLGTGSPIQNGFRKLKPTPGLELEWPFWKNLESQLQSALCSPCMWTRVKNVKSYQQKPYVCVSLPDSYSLQLFRSKYVTFLSHCPFLVCPPHFLYFVPVPHLRGLPCSLSLYSTASSLGLWTHRDPWGSGPNWLPLAPYELPVYCAITGLFPLVPLLWPVERCLTPLWSYSLALGCQWEKAEARKARGRSGEVSDEPHLPRPTFMEQFRATSSFGPHITRLAFCCPAKWSRCFEPFLNGPASQPLPSFHGALLLSYIIPVEPN